MISIENVILQTAEGGSVLHEYLGRQMLTIDEMISRRLETVIPASESESDDSEIFVVEE